MEPPFDQFLATAEKVVKERPDADADLVREVFTEVATLLYNGLALDGLDDHDTSAVVAGLCEALVAADPGAAVRAKAAAALNDDAGLHEPEAASAAYLISARLMQL